jgi:uncharacterized protein (DUF362 family)
MDNPKQRISWLLDDIHLPINPTNICIKANLNDYRKWETAATCDPYILESLLSVLRIRFPSASITILENDATGVNADNIFAYLGIDHVVRRNGCKFINVARDEWTTVDINGLHFKNLEIPKILTECDIFLTLPKLKSHTITKMTCGLKNQMGLFRPKRKIQYHHMVDDLIVDCNLAMKPTASLVDANLVMEGNYGPTYGSPKRLGLLIASSDVVAADSLCAKLFGLSPNSIRHIKKASELGLGNTKFEVVSDFDFDINNFRLKFNPLLFYAIRRMAGRLKA